MRTGRTFKRCSKCGARVTDRRCAACGSEVSSWAFVVDVATRGSARRQVRQGGFPTKGKAVAAMNRLQVETEAGTHLEPSRQTVGDYLTAWVAGVAGDGQLRRSTATSYETSVRAHILPRLGRVALQQLTRNDIRGAYDQLREAGRLKGAYGGLSAKTVHNVHLCLHKALGDALEEGLIKSNPANGAHKLSGSRPEMVCWSAEELRRFLDLVEAEDSYPLWRLAASTGMRRGELLGLRHRDLDLDQGRLQVYQQLSRGGRSIAFGPPKTRAGRRNVALDAITVEALRRQQRSQTPLKLAVGSGYRTDLDLVFARADGSPLDPDVVSQQFERWVSKIRVRRITLHGLRHTHATLGLQAGIHPEVMRERLGHSSIAVTLDLYSHAIPAMQEDAATRIAAVVDGR